MTIDITEDGVSHVNVYSKGKTLLGRSLTNFSAISFIHEGIEFASMEGFWFYTRLSLLGDKKAGLGKLTLTKLSGHAAKRQGKTLTDNISPSLWADFPQAEFQAAIKKGLDFRFRQNPDFKDDFTESPLPLKHYYVYGEGDKAIAREGGHEWVLDALDDLRSEYRSVGCRNFIVRVHGPEKILTAKAYKSVLAVQQVFAVFHAMNSLSGQMFSVRIEDDIKAICEAADVRTCFSDALFEANDTWEFLATMFYFTCDGKRTIPTIHFLEVVNQSGLNVNRYFLKED